MQLEFKVAKPVMLGDMFHVKHDDDWLAFGCD